MPYAAATSGRPEMDIYRIGRAVLAEIPVNGGAPLRFLATNVRRERTGIHATLHIVLGDRDLAWTTCNVERDEERGRLARKAHRILKSTPDTPKDCPAEQDLVRWLDEFCRQVWPVYTEALTPIPLVPEPGPPYNPLLDPPLIIEEGGTILYGPPGRGKSYTALALAVAADAGVPLGPIRPVRPLRTLYVNLERPTISMARRLYAVNVALELPPDRPLLMTPARGHTLHDLLSAIEHAVSSEGVELVVVDSLSRAGMGSLVEDASANRVMDALNSLHVPWVAIAHTPRADATHVFGSIMLDAAADICVQVITQRQDRSLGVGLKVTKANDIPPLPRFPILCYEFDGGVLVSIRKAAPREFPEIEAERQLPLPDLIVETILDQGPMTAAHLAELLGYSRSHVVNTLSALQAKGAVTAYRSGKEVLYALRQDTLPLGGEEGEGEDEL